MEVSITSVPVGTKFKYNDKEFVVTKRNYPFVDAKCITEPNEYEGLEVMFGSKCEIVEIDDNSDIIEQYFETTKWGFQLKERRNSHENISSQNNKQWLGK